MQRQATNAAFGLKLLQSFELLVHDTHPAPPKSHRTNIKFTELRSTTEDTSLYEENDWNKNERPAWNGQFASFFCFIHRSILGVAGLHRWRDLQWDQLSWPWSLGTDIANQICTKIGLNKPWQRSDTAEHLSKVGCKRLQKNLFKRRCLREKGWTIMKDFRSWINQAARPSKG